MPPDDNIQITPIEPEVKPSTPVFATPAPIPTPTVTSPTIPGPVVLGGIGLTVEQIDKIFANKPEVAAKLKQGIADRAIKRPGYSDHIKRHIAAGNCVYRGE